MNPRRNFITSVLSFLGLGAVIGVGKVSADGSPSAPEVPAVALGKSAGKTDRTNAAFDAIVKKQEDARQRDLNYLRTFILRAREAHPDIYDGTPMTSISVPYAFLTAGGREKQTGYIRWPEGRTIVSEKSPLAEDTELQHLVDSLYLKHTHAVEWLVNAIYQDFRHPALQHKDRLIRQAGSRIMPDRVMTMRFMIDIDELTPAQLAHTIIALAHDIAAEFHVKLARVQKEYPGCEIEYAYDTAIKTCIIFTGPMLEIFAYNEQAGRLTPEVIVPVGTLPSQG